MGMLAYFVHGFTNANQLTPTYILVLFIVSVLGVVWTLFTIFTYHRSRSNAFFVAFVDLLFIGALIAAVYELRFISDANCTHITAGSSTDISFGIFGTASVNGVHADTDKTCAMLKACFAFGICNCIFFAVTSLLAWIHAKRQPKEGKRETYVVRETHYSRHGGSRRGSASHRSHRSSHSGSHSGRRHAYV